MKLRIQCVFLLVVGLVASGVAQDVVDRVIATVNGTPVLQSDLERQQRYEEFIEHRPPAKAEAGGAALQRLIDQELLQEQMKGMEAPAEEVQAKIAEIRQQTPGAASESGWRAALSNYGMSEDDLRDRIAATVETVRFVDQRLRPSVHVDNKAVDTYYRDTFLPELHRRGAAEVPLAEVSGKIEEILAQREVDRQLETWLQDLRRQASVRMIDGGVVAGAAGGASVPNQ